MIYLESFDIEIAGGTPTYVKSDQQAISPMWTSSRVVISDLSLKSKILIAYRSAGLAFFESPELVTRYLLSFDSAIVVTASKSRVSMVRISHEYSQAFYQTETL